MTPALVIDASVTLAWCFTDEHDAYALAVLARLESAAALVPAIWTLEIGNALLVAERHRHLTPAESEQFLALLRQLPITVDAADPGELAAKIIDLGRAHRLSTYDAAYLELAMREGLPLATTAKEMRRAIARLGIPTIDA